MLEYIQKAWDIFKKNSLTFIVSQLIAILIPGIFLVLGGLVFVGTFLGSVGLSSIEDLATEEMIEQYVSTIISNPKTLSLLLRVVGYASIFFLIGILISMFFEIGIYGMASEAFRKRTRVRTMFKVARKYGVTAIVCLIIKFLIVTGLLVLSVLLGIVIPIIGFFIGMFVTILIVILFSLTSPAIVDNHGAIESIKKSLYVVRRNYLRVVGLLLVFALMGVVVSWIPWIGGLITSLIIAPLQKITFIGFYRKNKT